jgi:hypothetical protein
MYLFICTVIPICVNIVLQQAFPWSITFRGDIGDDFSPGGNSYGHVVVFKDRWRAKKENNPKESR